MADILLCPACFARHDAIEKRVIKPHPPPGILYLSAQLRDLAFEVRVFVSTLHQILDAIGPFDSLTGVTERKHAR